MTSMEAAPMNKHWLIFIILFIIPLTGAGVDIFIPSLPHIVHEFHANETLVQLAVSTYILGYGLCQLFFGPLSDSYGRKPLLMWGLLAYVLISFVTPQITDVHQLLVLRFLQGVAISAPGVVVKSMLSDGFTGEEFHVKANHMTLAWSLGPIIAPAIGGYLQHYLGWHYPFYFLAMYGLIAWLVCLLTLKETNQQRYPFEMSNVLRNLKVILSHRAFIGSIIILLSLYSLLTAFNVLGPFFVQVEMGYSPVVFGHVALVLGIAWFLGNFLNRIFQRWFSRKQLTTVAILLVLLFAFLMVGVAMLYPMNLFSLIAPVCLLFVSGGMALSNIFGLCLSLFPNNSGLASAAMGSLLVIGASGGSAVAALLASHSQLPLALMYVALGALSVLCYFALIMRRCG